MPNNIFLCFFFFQAEDGIRDAQESRGLGDVYKRQVMLGKTFKGLTDDMLEWQTREFLARESHRDRATVYVRPELVVEIAFSDLQASPRYPGGLALRLARVKRYRPDKRVEEADNMDAVRKIYAAQQ